MDNKELKSKAFSGAIWKLLERVLAQAVALIVSVAIARILNPEDYSVVGIVTIIISFLDVIIAGGLNSALIQKKDADKEDYSSVLFISLLLSVLLYIALYFFAPIIAEIYNQNVLTSIIRVMGLMMPISALKSVICAYVSANLQFKKFFWSTLGGTILSGVVGVYLALSGFGAWALVAQHFTNLFFDTLILMFTTRIKFTTTFSLRRIKNLFSYGWRILVSSLIDNTYAQINPLFIGLKFDATALSFYTKAKSFPTVITSTTSHTLSAVLFPVLSKVQDDDKLLLQYLRRYIRLASYISFPLMLGFFAVSNTFVDAILTEKWAPAALYMRIFCVASMFDMIHIGNTIVVKAKGRSDIYLAMEITKKITYFIIIGLFMAFGDSAVSVAMSTIVCNVWGVIVNTFPNRKLIGYRYIDQLKDVFPSLVYSTIMCVIVCLIGMLKINKYILLCVQIIAGAIIYLLISVIAKDESYSYFLTTAKEMLCSRKRKI